MSGWMIHSDKWSSLRSLETSEGTPVLNILSAHPPLPIKQRADALQVILDALNKKNIRYLEGDVLHVGTMAFVRLMALNEEYESTPVQAVIAKAFENTKQSTNIGNTGWKEGILRTVFYAATDGETDKEKELAMGLLEKLHSADPEFSSVEIENLVYPQEWDQTTTSVSDLIRNFQPG